MDSKDTDLKDISTKRKFIVWMKSPFHHAKRTVVALASVGAVISGLLGFHAAYTTFFSKPTNDIRIDAALPATPSLSIVVLPFTNLTGDASQTYMTEGLTI